MSDQHDRLSDDAIELGLARRAPHGADSALLESILSAATRTSQARSWMPAPLSRGAPYVRFAWIAVVLGLLLALAAFVVGRGIPRPPDLAVVVSPSPSPSLPTSTASAAPSSSSEPCVTDSLVVLTGDALPALEGDRLEGLGQGRGVYVAGRPPRLWAVGPGQGSATLIAAVEPGVGILDVLDMSPDGSNALIRAGDISPSGFIPECADLYLVRTDGSGATRLTTFGAGRFVAGGAFSPDGRRVAFPWWDPGTITVLDLESGLTVDQACNVPYSSFPIQIDWSPSGDRIFVDCNGALTILDPTGTTTAIELPDEVALSFSWIDDRKLLVARAPGGSGPGGVQIDYFDVVSLTSTLVVTLKDPDIEVVAGASGVSPDGRWLAFQAYDRSGRLGNDGTGGGYLVNLSGGTPTRILHAGSVPWFMSWSADSRVLVYVGPDESDARTLAVTRLVVETLRRSTIGALPDHVQGVWRIP